MCHLLDCEVPVFQIDDRPLLREPGCRGSPGRGGAWAGPGRTSIQSVLPFEAPPEVRLHGEAVPRWSIELSAGPASWRALLRICEANYPGAAGKNETIAHGTTINALYCQGGPFCPSTPSLGSLTAAETWSDVDGHRITGQQQRLVDALRGAGFADTCLVVVNVDSRRERVTQEELRLLVEKAEQSLPSELALGSQDG